MNGQSSQVGALMSSHLAALAASRATEPYSHWPTFGLTEDIRPALAEAQRAEQSSVLATLFRVEGGAPRDVGAQMLFVGETMAGFLSGGCIEADVALHANDVLSTGQPCRLTYGEGGPVDVRLPCGSQIEVFLERISPHDAASASLFALTGSRRPAIWFTDGKTRACMDDGSPELLPRFDRLIEARKGSAICGYSDEPFSLFKVHVPPTRLIAIGADPVTLATARLAVEMGMETIVIRPKGPQEHPVNGARYFRCNVVEALDEIVPDPWTAIAVLSHDKEQEHEALKAALATPAGYIGALGSRRRVPERNTRLLSSGIKPNTIGRIYTPIGLPIGGKSPWKVALSVLAEIVAEIG